MVYSEPWDAAHRLPDCWVSGLRRKGDMNFTLAAVSNSGNHRDGCESKGARYHIPRPTVEMPSHEAEQLVVAKKTGNAVGAKGLRQHGQSVANFTKDEPQI